MEVNNGKLHSVQRSGSRRRNSWRCIWGGSCWAPMAISAILAVPALRLLKAARSSRRWEITRSPTIPIRLAMRHRSITAWGPSRGSRVQGAPRRCAAVLPRGPPRPMAPSVDAATDRVRCSVHASIMQRLGYLLPDCGRAIPLVHRGERVDA
jgi:hypothetical protein